MPLLTAAQLASVKAALSAVLNDNPVSITIRRGASTLSAQTVRVERMARSSREVQPDGSKAQVADVVVLGTTSLDIQQGDRFTIDGRLYRVTFVRPNTDLCVQAEAVLED